jgi:hypothetical protein
MTSSGTITVTPKDDTPESVEILALKAELVEIKSAQATVTHNKHHHDGVSNNAVTGCHISEMWQKSSRHMLV